MSKFDKKLTKPQVDAIFKRAYQEGVFGTPLAHEDAQMIVQMQRRVLKAGGPENVSQVTRDVLGMLTKIVRSDNPQK